MIAGLLEVGVCIDVGRVGIRAAVKNRSNLRSGSSAELSPWLTPIDRQARLEARWTVGRLSPRLMLETGLDQAEAKTFIVGIDALVF